MLTFLVVGDWGRRGAPGQRAVACGMARQARHLRPRFVLSTGDNFYEDGVDGLGDAHWQESFEQVYTDPALQVPWYAALGNHDYRGCVASQLAYTRLSTRWRMPARYYSFTEHVDAQTTVEFFVLETVPFLARYHPGGVEATAGVAEQDAEAQRAWLDAALGHSVASWKVVVGHHPVVSGSPFHGCSAELEEALQPVLEAHAVHAYFCGHEHDLQHLHTGGVHHFVSGAGSESRQTGTIGLTRCSRASLGFLAVGVTARRMHVWFCNAAGRLLYYAGVPSHAHRAQPSRLFV
jgi:tartrate-resistant acid phosphatase type 5